MNGRPAIGRLIDTASSYSGIDERYIIIPDADENVENKFYSSNGSYVKPDTKVRMNEYEKWAKRLSKEAVGKLIGENNFNAAAIEKLVTISCTGFFAPGLDYFLMEEFNIPRNR